MTHSLSDYDELDRFALGLMRTGGTGYFRGTEVRCDHRLGSRVWTIYGSKIVRFTADIGPDDLDYTTERLVRAGILDGPRS